MCYSIVDVLKWEHLSVSISSTGGLCGSQIATICQVFLSYVTVDDICSWRFHAICLAFLARFFFLFQWPCFPSITFVYKISMSHFAHWSLIIKYFFLMPCPMQDRFRYTLKIITRHTLVTWCLTNCYMCGNFCFCQTHMLR